MSTAASAESRIQRALAGLDEARSSNSGEGPLLAAQHRLAHAYRAARRFDEAIDWFAATADESAGFYGVDHPETLRYRSSLANCHYAAGHTNLAIQMFRELYEKRLEILGREHADTMRSRGSLANALNLAGRAREAEALHRDNLGEREGALGVEHPSTQASRRNLERLAGDSVDSGSGGPDAG